VVVGLARVSGHGTLERGLLLASPRPLIKAARAPRASRPSLGRVGVGFRFLHELLPFLPNLGGVRVRVGTPPLLYQTLKCDPMGSIYVDMFGQYSATTIICMLLNRCNDSYI
jgi:hypothetical protein